ncbi:MAG: sigma-70 family RNA polymerase sigma factor [Gemmataceae bacterium]
MPDEPTEIELLDRLRAGDQSALAILYDRYRDKLRRMVQVRLDPRLGGRVAPSDVLQEAYIDALKRYPHFFEKVDQPFFGWLRLVIGQRLIDVHREHLGAKMRDARQEVSLASPVGGGAAASSLCLAACLVGQLSTPSHIAAKQETLDRLEQALEGLEPLDREVLALRHFEELSNAETAQVLGILPAAASKRYVRALARLKDVLVELGE